MINMRLLSLLVIFCFIYSCEKEAKSIPLTIKEETPEKPKQAVIISSDEVLQEMVNIPGSTFHFGKDIGIFDENGEKIAPYVDVTLDEFSCARKTVSQGLYAQLMGVNPSKNKRDDSFVSNVSWFDAVKFCNELSKYAGFDTCYQMVGEQVNCDWRANGFRLLTEAEWEYVASDSSNSIILDKYEWCWDWFGKYEPGAKTNPIGKYYGSQRVSAYQDLTYHFRRRQGLQPNETNGRLGFRVARREGGSHSFIPDPLELTMMEKADSAGCSGDIVFTSFYDLDLVFASNWTPRIYFFDVQTATKVVYDFAALTYQNYNNDISMSGDGRTLIVTILHDSGKYISETGACVIGLDIQSGKELFKQTFVDELDSSVADLVIVSVKMSDSGKYTIVESSGKVQGSSRDKSLPGDSYTFLLDKTGSVIGKYKGVTLSDVDFDEDEDVVSFMSLMGTVRGEFTINCLTGELMKVDSERKKREDYYAPDHD